MMTATFARTNTPDHFEHINTEHGLSNNSITSIVQDSVGIMWIATRYGLNSYDGLHVRAYESRIGEANALIENQIRDMIHGHMKLYLLTPNYLSIYDILSDEFKNIHLPQMRAIYLDGEKLWIAQRNTLSFYDTQAGKLDLDVIDLDATLNISKLIIRENQIYIGTQSGLYSYDLKTKKKTCIIELVNVSELYEDHKGALWVGTLTDGVFCLNSKNEMRHYTYPMISHDFVRSIQQDQDGQIWIGTLKGLDLLDPEACTSQTITAYINDASRLSHSSVWDIYCDREGLLWIGTYFGGVDIMNVKDQAVNHYKILQEPGDVLPSNIMGSIVEDRDKNLYIATHGGGLNFFDRKTEQFTRYTADPQQKGALGCNNIQDLYNYKDSVLILTTHTDGINLFDLKTKCFRSLRHSESVKQYIPSKTITDIEPYGDYFFLSTQNGLLVYDLLSDRVWPFHGNNILNLTGIRVRQSTVDHKGQIWIGTETDGLFCYNPRSGLISHYNINPSVSNSIISNEINCIYEDRVKRIWIGTNSGLSLYQTSTDNFINFTKEDGLISNTVYEICDSRYVDIFITTKDGFSNFVLADESFTNYSSFSGMPLKPVTHKSLLYSSTDDIFVGGHNGLIQFKEKDVMYPIRKGNPIYITGMKINGKYMSVSDSVNVLDKNLLWTDELQLGHQQNTLAIQFSDLSMTSNERLEFEYSLEGFDKHFHKSNVAQEAIYTNLPPGKYEFVVRTVSDKLLNGRVDKRLKINIAPPFYYSMPAILFYVIVVIAIILLIFRLYYLRKMTLISLEQEQKDHLREREYDQAKLRFFTNVSHELRTPLTLISGQLEQMLDCQNLDPLLSKRTLRAFESTTKLQNLVDELLDLRKQQNGFAILNLRILDMISFVNEVYVNYIELAADRGIEYTLDMDTHTPIYTLADKVELEKVCFNLLSNAFKFTEKGKISVRVYTEDDCFCFVVKDTGIGISKENLDHVFERFYQEPTSGYSPVVRGTGIGLAIVKHIVMEHKGEVKIDSTLGEGSQFMVKIPLAKPELECSVDEVDSKEDIRDYIKLDSGVSVDEIVAALKSKGHAAIEHTILVVDDNIMMLDFLNDILSPYFNVLVASNGQEGYDKAVQYQPDLILSDVMMPNITGTKMCTMIKGNLQTSHIPVVLLTAKVATEHKIEGLALGADDYITKPFSIKLLLARIHNIIDSRRQLQERFSNEPNVGYKQISTPNSEDEKFLAKAFDVILKNLSNENYSADQFASDMLMGRTNFFKKLKSVVNMTPNNFILTVRLKHAVELLRTRPDLSIGEISDQCGFNSQQYFSSCFKRKFSISPAQFLKNQDMKLVEV